MRGRERTCARVHPVHGFVGPYEYSELAFAAMKIRLPRSYGDPPVTRMTCKRGETRRACIIFRTTSFSRSRVSAPAAKDAKCRVSPAKSTTIPAPDDRKEPQTLHPRSRAHLERTQTSTRRPCFPMYILDNAVRSHMFNAT